MKRAEDSSILAKAAKTNRKYDNIVIGSSLSAVVFAFNNQYPLFFTHPRKPFRFDHLGPQSDLGCVKLSTPPKEIQTFDGPKILGCPKYLLWERLLFLLSLEGLVPLSDLCGSIRAVDQRVVCSNDYSKIFEFDYGVCHYFGDDNSSGFVFEKKIAKPKFVCYDWIAFNRGGKHDIDYIRTGDDLAREMWFYPSDRIDGNTAVKDACVVSLLSADQVEHFDYSETMARFKMIHEMELRGMKGKFNGYGPNGKPKYYKFRTTSLYRQKYSAGARYEPKSERIRVVKQDEEALLLNLSKASMAYDKFLRYL